MSPKEGAPKKRNSLTSDNIYVFALETQMKNHGFTLEQAIKMFEKEIEESPGGGVEHLKPFNAAVDFLKRKKDKK